jgi:hypothetical protein
MGMKRRVAFRSEEIQGPGFFQGFDRHSRHTHAYGETLLGSLPICENLEVATYGVLICS